MLSTGSHCVRPAIRKPVSSRCFTAVSRTSQARTRSGPVRQRGGAGSGTVPHRDLHSLRERGPRDVAAGPAPAGVGLVLGHLERLRRGRVEHLPPVRRAGRVALCKRCAVSGALRRQVGLDVVRVLGLGQRRARMAGLAARAASAGCVSMSAWDPSSEPAAWRGHRSSAACRCYGCTGLPAAPTPPPVAAPAGGRSTTPRRGRADRPFTLHLSEFRGREQAGLGPACRVLRGLPHSGHGASRKASRDISATDCFPLATPASAAPSRANPRNRPALCPGYSPRLPPAPGAWVVTIVKPFAETTRQARAARRRVLRLQHRRKTPGRPGTARAPVWRADLPAGRPSPQLSCPDRCPWQRQTLRPLPVGKQSADFRPAARRLVHLRKPRLLEPVQHLASPQCVQLAHLALQGLERGTPLVQLRPRLRALDPVSRFATVHATAKILLDASGVATQRPLAHEQHSHPHRKRFLLHFLLQSASLVRLCAENRPWELPPP